MLGWRQLWPDETAEVALALHGSGAGEGATVVVLAAGGGSRKALAVASPPASPRALKRSLTSPSPAKGRPHGFSSEAGAGAGGAGGEDGSGAGSEFEKAHDAAARAQDALALLVEDMEGAVMEQVVPIHARLSQTPRKLTRTPTPRDPMKYLNT